MLSARRSLSLFLAAVICLAFWQVWLTWHLMEQDRGLERQRSREHLAQTADLAVAEVSRNLGNWQLILRGIESLPPPPSVLARVPSGSTFILISASDVATYPQKALLFLPDALAPAAAGTDGFETADKLEFREPHYGDALAELQHLAQNQATRPEALLRIARIQRKMGKREAALDTYARLMHDESLSSASSTSGTPYGLLAARARCHILTELGRETFAAQEAHLIRVALTQAHWRLGRESFEFEWAELTRFGLTAERPPQPAFQFAVLVAELFDRWQSAVHSNATSSGQELRPDSSLLISSVTSGHLSAMLSSGDWLKSSMGSAASLSDVRWKFLPPGRAAEDDFSVTRSLADAQLPGRLQFVDVHPPSGIASSRRLVWLTGVGLMVLLVLVSAYAVNRGISQELRVARLQSDFVSAVSHEFRSPLTTLRTITELLVQNRISDESRRQTSYEFLDRETTRLHRLVEALLDFGRMESGRKQYRLQPHDAFQLVRSAVAEFSEEAAASGFRVETKLDSASANVRADEEAFQRAFRNLLENAVKYSPGGRTVWVSGTVDEHHVSISVRDEGMGIDPKEQRQVFQKFVRGTAAKKAGIKGTGIGLSMVHQISKALGGNVHLESKVGAGSTFTIVLPLAHQ